MSGYKRVNYYELCRLCTSTEGTKMHIFREEGRRRQLSVKIQLCLPLQVLEEDSLPKIICTDCVEKLESFYEFREACVNAEAMLESYFSTIRAEDHKEGRVAAVYVREMMSSKTQEMKPSKVEPPGPPPATLVLPVGPDGLSNIMQAAGIQIITETDPTRMQPLLGTTPTVVETCDGSRYAYLSNAVPAPELIKQPEPKIEVTKQSNSDSSDEASQQSPPSQTITFASGVPGQEMMVHFNLKDPDATNAQLQRASIAQLGELLRMNLVEGANLVRDPSAPGGFRLVGLPTPLLASQQVQEQPQEQQQLQHQQQLHPHQHQEQPHLQQQHLSQQTLPVPDHDSEQNTHPNISTSQKKQPVTDKQESIIQHPTERVDQSQQFSTQHIHHPFIHVGEQESEMIIGTDPEGMCEHCCKTFDSEEELCAHRSLCSAIEAVVSGAGGGGECSEGDEKTFFACEECGKTFKRKEHLFQHQKLHTGERPYVCEHCNKSFSRKEHLMRHAVSHSGTKLFECEQCGKNFSRKDNLHKHRKTHKVPGPFICDVCGKSFVVKHYYLMHQACHGAAVEDENGEIIEDPLLFKCDICGKGFPNKVFLSTHRARHRKKIDANKANLNDSEEQLLQHKQTPQDHKQQQENQHLHIQQHVNQQSEDDSHHHEIQHLVDGNHIVPVTLQAGTNGIPINTVLSPHILQQMVPTSTQAPAVIQVQTSSSGTTYLCTPELLETYRRLHSS